MKTSPLKIVLSFSFVVAFAFSSRGQATSWDFSTGAQGWTVMHSLAGAVSGGVYHLGVTGSDPYIYSQNMIINPTIYGQLHVRVKNGTASKQFQVFWITNTDNVWNQQKSLFYPVTPNDTGFSDYTMTLLGNPLWAGSITKMRFDMGDTVNVGDSILLDQVNFNAYDMGLDNGTLHVRLDLTRGGSISYISTSGSTRSLVNIGDEGRYIQQSYYAGKYVNRTAEGQSANWSPWPWNPIQAGDSHSNRAAILAFTRGADTLYTKCRPLLWDMDSMPAEAEMEQWTSLNGNIVSVHCKLTCHRTDTIYGEVSDGQELPAVYIISALSNLYSYIGTQPFTSAPPQQIPVVNLSSGFWGVYDSVAEHWMAFVDNSLWGMGVYNTGTTVFLAGLAGVAGGEASSANTNYIAPGGEALLKKNSVFEYSYYLVVGTLTEIRNDIYRLNGTTTGISPPPEEYELSIYPNPANKVVYIRLLGQDRDNILMELFNVQGQVVLSNKISNKYELNTSALPKGIYFIRLKGNDYVWNRRLVIE